MRGARRTRIDRGEVAASAPKDAALACDYLVDCVDSGLVQEEYNSGPFFFKHVHTRDANFLVDSDYNITGIVDWELAFLAPKESAFQRLLFMFNMDHVLEGNRLSQDEELFAQQFTKVGRADLAKLIIRGGRKSFIFEMSAATDPYVGDQFEKLLCTLLQVMGASSSGGAMSWEAWENMAQRRDGETKP
jgi:hypothetical protein